ncbi:MAG: PIN domain-containing protein [Acidobacteriota bacterium]|nr:PIN domain-containing protein [Acidobacteriota bacterium]
MKLSLPMRISSFWLWFQAVGKSGELFKHTPKIQKATKLSKDEILELLSSIINQIKFYEEDLISVGNWVEAFRLCRDVDEKDTPYVALALELDAKLWTKDNELKIGLRSKGFDKFYQSE